MFRKVVFFSVFVLALLAGCTRTEKSDASAADFKLQDLSGKVVRLSDFHGKPVLLDFWATWCPPCRESIPGIEKLYKNYGPKGLVVLGISLDDGGWDSVKSFVAQHGITYPVLKGTESVESEYHVRSIPMMVVIDKNGKVVKRYLGLGGDDDLEKDIKAVL